MGSRTLWSRSAQARTCSLFQFEFHAFTVNDMQSERKLPNQKNKQHSWTKWLHRPGCACTNTSGIKSTKKRRNQSCLATGACVVCYCRCANPTYWFAGATQAHEQCDVIKTRNKHQIRILGDEIRLRDFVEATATR